MPIYSLLRYNKNSNIFLIIFILSAVSFAFAFEIRPNKSKQSQLSESKRISRANDIGEAVSGGAYRDQPAQDSLEPGNKSLSDAEKEARDLRRQGYNLQRAGDIDAALNMFRQVVMLDPFYGVVFNDLGLIYEAKGLFTEAQESYLTAIKLDPGYLSAYTNLALLYENKRDLQKARFYWQKRAELGSIYDPWTQIASRRLKDYSVTVQDDDRVVEEQEVIRLINSQTRYKALLRQDDQALSKLYYEKAKESYVREDYAQAVKEALDAQQLDRENKEIEAFIDKASLRALSK